MNTNMTVFKCFSKIFAYYVLWTQNSELSESYPQNEYQHDRVEMVFKDVHFFVLWKKVDSAFIGLRPV